LECRYSMKHQRFNEQFAFIYEAAVRLAQAVEADMMLVLLDAPTDWEALREHSDGRPILVVANKPDQLVGASEIGLKTLAIDLEDDPVYERLTQSLLEGIAIGVLEAGARVIAVYSGFEAGRIDSVSDIRLNEHLGRLTIRDLREIKTRVPLETLKSVVDLAVEIGREGRESKRVGTLFVVGDTRKVMQKSHAIGFDPVKGYSKKERNLRDGRVRESLKEIAQMDGAFVVSSDGTIEASCRMVETVQVDITLSKGLGTRHWAAAAISKSTHAIAVTVSESNGTVRIFQQGEVKLRIEPFQRAMKWKAFEYEPPAKEKDKEDES
jgi:diadenylate cyclase